MPNNSWRPTIKKIDYVTLIIYWNIIKILLVVNELHTNHRFKSFTLSINIVQRYQKLPIFNANSGILSCETRTERRTDSHTDDGWTDTRTTWRKQNILQIRCILVWFWHWEAHPLNIIWTMRSADVWQNFKPLIWKRPFSFCALVNLHAVGMAGNTINWQVLCR